jgi:hypothetical protein
MFQDFNASDAIERLIRERDRFRTGSVQFNGRQPGARNFERRFVDIDSGQPGSRIASGTLFKPRANVTTYVEQRSGRPRDEIGHAHTGGVTRCGNLPAPGFSTWFPLPVILSPYPTRGREVLWPRRATSRGRTPGCGRAAIRSTFLRAGCRRYRRTDRPAANHRTHAGLGVR